MHDLWLWPEVGPRNEAMQARVATRFEHGYDSSQGQLGFDGGATQGESMQPLQPVSQSLSSSC
jgi:hypothetical protein